MSVRRERVPLTGRSTGRATGRPTGRDEGGGDAAPKRNSLDASKSFLVARANADMEAARARKAERDAQGLSTARASSLPALVSPSPESESAVDALRRNHVFGIGLYQGRHTRVARGEPARARVQLRL